MSLNRLFPAQPQPEIARSATVPGSVQLGVVQNRDPDEGKCQA
jgi:hypothetical protein